MLTPLSHEELILFHTPGACSRVTLNALEELGLTYEDRPIDIFKGAQHRPDFRAINPKGKVPALLVSGVLLTETPAILSWLIEAYPQGKLMPDGSAIECAKSFSDLIWCSNTLHPLVRAIRMPQRMTSADPEPVRAAAVEQISPMLGSMEQRLGGVLWWFGENWSILDVYLGWITGMCLGARMDMQPFPALLDHMARVRLRPSFLRALQREQQALGSAGIVLPGGQL